ncbi:MAG: SIS domain-containing protein [Thermotogota bacterium]|nr:SIS domain-containing protein [Thermotogota bacterium]
MITKKEIFEQPTAFKFVSDNYENLVADMKALLRDKEIKKIAFIGCGSSYYLAMGLAKHLNRLTQSESNGFYFSGSEIIGDLRNIEKDTLYVGISRSGESTETVNALKKLKKTGNLTGALTCESESNIIPEASAFITLDFIKEESVVMTKSFTSMAFVFTALLQDVFASGDLDAYMNSVVKETETILTNSEEYLNKLNVGSFDHFVFLGYDEYLAASMEGLIKVTETSLTEVDAFQTLEYRHGPKSKLHQGTLVVIASNEKTFELEEKVAHEIESYNAKVLLLSSKDSSFSHITLMPDPEYRNWFLRVIPLQLIGIKRAVFKGLNPDEPRNLSKVVLL